MSAIGGPAQLIPGPGKRELHSTGELAPVSHGSLAPHIGSNSSTVFFLDGSGSLAQRPGPPVSYHGVPLSSKCAFRGGDLGHVGSWGLRLTGGGVTTLADGSLFATGIACLGGSAQTAKQRVTSASSLIGLSSTDGGFRWDYSGPVLTAASMPESVVGPTENDVELLADRKTLMVVARTVKATPSLDASASPESSPCVAGWRWHVHHPRPGG